MYLTRTHRQTEPLNRGTDSECLDETIINTVGFSCGMCASLLFSPKSSPHWSLPHNDAKISFTLHGRSLTGVSGEKRLFVVLAC